MYGGQLFAGSGGARRRRIAAALSTGTLVAASYAVTLIAGGGTASAATTADLSLVQHVSGGAASGQTVVAVTVHNAGSATANNVNLITMQKSTSNFILTSVPHGPCETAIPPSGYLGMTSCQLGSLSTGASITQTFTYTGQTGVEFSNYATVGVSSPADPKVTNNYSTVSSWFGPRADLALSGTAAAGKTKGTATLVSTVVNHGPNTANALQMIVEIKSSAYKSVHASSPTSSSCQFIPAASGYNRAVACTTNTLATGKKWVMTFAYTGTARGALTVKTTVSANGPSDPVTTNNATTRTTAYKS